MARQHDQFFRRVFDSFNDPLAIYQRDYRIFAVNQALSQIYQRSPEDMVGRPCYQVFHDRSQKCRECHVEEFFHTGETHRREKLIMLPDGRQHHFEFHCFPVKDAHRHTVLALEHGRDITMRKTLEKELNISEERYRTIVELAREGIMIVDQEARITFANQCMTGMLGYPPEELLGLSVFALLDESAARVVKAQMDQRRKGLADVYELNLRKRDGTNLLGLIAAAPLMVNGNFLGSVAVVTDIAHCKEVEAELRAAKEFNEKIINGITDNLVVVDPGTYQIVQANDSFLTRVGRSPAGVLGHPCYEIILGRASPCEGDGAPCPVRQAAQSKNPVVLDRVYPDAQGADRMLRIAAYPLLNSREDVDLIIRLESDVTDKRKMEETLAVRSRELQKTQHQLETLFAVSQHVSAKDSLPELVHALQDIAQEIFPTSDPILLILDGEGQDFLDLEDCVPTVTEPLRSLTVRLGEAGLVMDFIQYLREIKDPHLITRGEDLHLPPFLKKISELYASWFGFPILVQQYCLGYFLLGSTTHQDYSKEDLHFFHALFGQIAGYLRHLVLHDARNNHLPPQEHEKISHAGIIGKSKKMYDIYELIDLISKSEATVLITGENGTGKELVAQAIHRQSHRHRGPFVVANCSAYSPSLLESELFGHERGAFTGAIRQRKGRIERAHGGTLFLDEIGDISPATQVLLLRFLQDHCFERVGGERAIEADVRVLAATNRDLRRSVELGQFRDDLYYRLNVISIHLPPLKERKEDIPLLALHFLKKYNAKEGKHIVTIAVDAMEALMDYDWPGNVRQLENAVSHAVILTQGEVIRRRHFPRFLRESPLGTAATSLAENERQLILRVLQEANWNKHDAARRLKVSRSTLYSKIRRHGLEQNWGSISIQR